MKLPGTTDDLGTALREMPGRIYAVLDGAQFEHLPTRLKQVGLEYHELYADEVDMPQLHTGPHLVACPTGYAIEQVRDVMAGMPSVVWWAFPDEGDETENAVMSHMRRLALADVPVERGLQVMGPPRHGQILSSDPFEPVLFRHCDPDVMATLMPVLRPGQQAQLFGHALAIVAETPDGGMVKAMNPAPDAAGSEASFGRLKLGREQYKELTAAYRTALRRRALFEFGPELADHDRDSRELQILDAIHRGEGYGLVEKNQLWEFVALDVRYGARFELEKGRETVLSQLKDDSRGPGERLFRAEMSAQMARGEDKTTVSGRRKR